MISFLVFVAGSAAAGPFSGPGLNTHGQFLPISELRQFDVKAHEILNLVHSERFVALMKFQAGRALEAYDEALALLPAADRRTQKPGLMMASIYRTLLEEIARDDFKVLDQRVSLTPVRKLWLAWRVQALGKL